LPDAVIITDGSGKMLAWNSTAENLYGKDWHQMSQSHADEIYEDPFVKGVVLSVNTPGGGVVESADIYDGIRKLQEEKGIPIYVSMGGMAASGGYYVSGSSGFLLVWVGPNEKDHTGSDWKCKALSAGRPVPYGIWGRLYGAGLSNSDA